MSLPLPKIRGWVIFKPIKASIGTIIEFLYILYANCRYWYTLYAVNGYMNVGMYVFMYVCMHIM